MEEPDFVPPTAAEQAAQDLEDLTLEAQAESEMEAETETGAEAEGEVQGEEADANAKFLQQFSGNRGGRTGCRSDCRSFVGELKVKLDDCCLKVSTSLASGGAQPLDYTVTLMASTRGLMLRTASALQKLHDTMRVAPERYTEAQRQALDEMVTLYVKLSDDFERGKLKLKDLRLALLRMSDTLVHVLQYEAPLFYVPSRQDAVMQIERNVFDTAPLAAWEAENTEDTGEQPPPFVQERRAAASAAQQQQQQQRKQAAVAKAQETRVKNVQDARQWLEDNYLPAADLQTNVRTECRVEYLDPDNRVLHLHPDRAVQRTVKAYQQALDRLLSAPEVAFDRLASAVTTSCTGGREFRLAKPQQLVSLLVRPGAPSNGMLVQHMVGSGKTCTGLAVAHFFYRAAAQLSPDRYPRVYWVTRRALASPAEIKKNLCCMLPAQQDVEQAFETFQQHVKFTTHKILTNALTGIGQSNLESPAHYWAQEYGKNFAAAAGVDVLRNCLLVVDEAHRMLESGEDQTPDFEVLQRAVWRSYERNRDRGESVKLLLMTATPVQSDVTAVVRLLDLLISEPAERFQRQNRAATVANVQTDLLQRPANFQKYARGLISWYDPTEDRNLFAARINVSKMLPYLSVTQRDILETMCHRAAARREQNRMEVWERQRQQWEQKRDRSGRLVHRGQQYPVPRPEGPEAANYAYNRGLVECYRTAQNWGGFTPNRLLPEYSIGAREYHPEFVRQTLPVFSPKLVHLIDTIRALNREDKRLFGHTFKHMIFSAVPGGLGAKLVAAGLAAHGFGYIPIESHGRRRDDPLRDEDLVPWRCGKRSCPNGNFVVITRTHLSELPSAAAAEDELRSEVDTELISETGTAELGTGAPRPNNMNWLRTHVIPRFNDRERNRHGEQIQYIVLDGYSREGIDLFDVKYVHLFEPPPRVADEVQAVGRAFRRCGHVGLRMHRQNGWEVQVFVYDIGSRRPEDLSLATEGLTPAEKRERTLRQRPGAKEPWTAHEEAELQERLQQQQEEHAAEQLRRALELPGVTEFTRRIGREDAEPPTAYGRRSSAPPEQRVYFPYGGRADQYWTITDHVRNDWELPSVRGNVERMMNALAQAAVDRNRY